MGSHEAPSDTRTGGRLNFMGVCGRKLTLGHLGSGSSRTSGKLCSNLGHADWKEHIRKTRGKRRK